MKLSNVIFIFENEEGLVDFWNNTIGKSQNSEITHNTFICMKHKWLLKLIKFILRIKG